MRSCNLVNFWSTKKHVARVSNFDDIPRLFFCWCFFCFADSFQHLPSGSTIFYPRLDCVNLPEIVLLANMRSCALWNLQWTFWLCESQTVTLWQLQRMKFVSSLVVFFVLLGSEHFFWTESIHRTGPDCCLFLFDGLVWRDIMICDVQFIILAHNRLV